MRHQRPEVRVVTRFKPLTADEKSHHKNKKISPLCVVFDEQKIEVLDRTHQAGAPPSPEFTAHRKRNGPINETSKNFTMDEVFSEKTTQEEMFEHVGLPIVKNVLKGYNGTLLAYGQTGSGKTHSMLGPDGGSVDVFTSDTPLYHLRGLIPRMVEALFQRLGAMDPAERKWNVSLSIFEIYKEEILDLLGRGTPPLSNGTPKKEKFRIREDLIHGQGIYVESLERPEVRTADDVMSLIRYAANKRKTAVTNINESSSRSHSLVVLYVDQVDYTNTRHGQRIVSRLNLVDLAGSEKLSKTLAEGDRLEEAKKINLSLTLLGNVIYKLTDGKSGYVPYRDSKLTRILQESLGGNSITTLMCHCSTAMYNREETLSTLRFAQRTKRVRNKPQINKDLSATELKLQLVAAEQKIESLENKLRIKSDIIARQKESRESKDLELEGLIESLMREIEQLREELSAKEEELQHEKSRSELYKQEAADLKEELRRLRERNAKQKDTLEEALKRSQLENAALTNQLEALKEELMAQAALPSPPIRSHTPVHQPSTPKCLEGSNTFERTFNTAGKTVESQIHRSSFMLDRPSGVPPSRKGGVVEAGEDMIRLEDPPAEGSRWNRCPMCFYLLPVPWTLDAATNTDPIEGLLSQYAADRAAAPMDIKKRSNSRSEANDAARQMGADEVTRVLGATGDMLRRILVGGASAVEEGEVAPASQDVLQAVEHLEEVLHAIGEALEDDAFLLHAKTTSTTDANKEAEPDPAKYQQLRDALAMAERLLAAWRGEQAGGADQLATALVNREPLRFHGSRALRPLTEDDRVAFADHEHTLVAAELEGVYRRLVQQVEREAQGSANKRKLVGSQALPLLLPPHHAREWGAEMERAMKTEADEHLSRNDKSDHACPMVSPALDDVSHTLEALVSRHDAHLAELLTAQWKDSVTAGTAQHTAALDKALQQLKRELARYCDNFLQDTVVGLEQPLDAAALEALRKKLEQHAEVLIRSMYEKAQEEEKAQQVLLREALSACIKSDHNDLENDLNEFFNSAPQPLASAISAAVGRDGPLSTEEADNLSAAVLSCAQGRVDRLLRQRDQAALRRLGELDKEHEAWVATDLQKREAALQSSAAFNIAQLIAKMNVLATYEQYCLPDSPEHFLTEPQLAQLAAQLPLLGGEMLSRDAAVQDWSEKERGRVHVPLAQLGEDIREVHDAATETSCATQDEMLKALRDAISESYAERRKTGDGQLTNSLEDLVTAAALPAETQEKVHHAIRNLQAALEETHAAAQQKMDDELHSLVAGELEKAKETLQALQAREREAIVAALTASAQNQLSALASGQAEWNDCVEALQKCAKEEVERSCRSQHDLQEALETTLAQQQRRQHQNLAAKTARESVAAVERACEELAEELHAQRFAEEASGQALPHEGITHEAIDELCNRLRAEALEKLAQAEEEQEAAAAGEFARWRASQARAASEEEEAMQVHLESLTSTALDHLTNYWKEQLTATHVASEKVHIASPSPLTPEKIHALGESLGNVERVGENVESYDAGTQARLMNNVGAAAEESGEHLYAQALKVCEVQQQQLSATEACECARAVQVRMQREAVEDDVLEAMPEKLSRLLQRSSALTVEQKEEAQAPVDQLAEALTGVLTEERAHLTKRLEDVLLEEQSHAAEKHQMVTQDMVQQLREDVKESLVAHCKRLVAESSPITGQEMEEAVAPMDAICQKAVAALCEMNEKLQEQELRTLEAQLQSCCARSAELEQSRLEQLAERAIVSSCEALKAAASEDGSEFTQAQEEALEAELRSTVKDVLSSHQEEKMNRQVEATSAMVAELRETQAAANTALMARLQETLHEEVLQMVNEVCQAAVITTVDDAPSSLHASALVHEMLSGEVSHCFREGEWSAEKHHALAQQIAALPKDDQRDLSYLIGAESGKDGLTNEIDKLAVSTHTDIEVKRVEPHILEAMAQDIRELDDSGTRLLAHCLAVYSMAATPCEESTADSLKALAAYFDEIGADEAKRHCLTNVLIDSGLSPAALVQVLEQLKQQQEVHEKNTVGYTATEYAAHEGASASAIVERWTHHAVPLCSLVDGAAVEEVCSSMNAPSPAVLEAVEEQAWLLVQDYAEKAVDRVEPTSSLAFVSPVVAHQFLRHAGSEEVPYQATAVHPLMESLMLADLSALEAIESVLKRHPLYTFDASEAPQSATPYATEELQVAARALQRVLDHNEKRYHASQALRSFRLASPTVTSGSAPEAKESRTLRSVQHALRESSESTSESVAYFASTVDELLAQPPIFQEAVSSLLTAQEDQAALHTATQSVAAAIREVLTAQRRYVLDSCTARSEGHAASDLSTTSSEGACQVLWAAQHLAATSKQAPLTSAEEAEAMAEEVGWATTALRRVAEEASQKVEALAPTETADEKAQQEAAVWRVLQQDTIQQEIAALEREASTEIFLLKRRQGEVQEVTTSVGDALQIPPSSALTASQMRDGLNVLEYRLDLMEARERPHVRRAKERVLDTSDEKTGADFRKTLTRFAYATGAVDCGTMTDSAPITPPQVIAGLKELLGCMGVSEAEVAQVDSTSYHPALERLRREVLFMKKAEEPSLRREIERRQGDLAAIFDVMTELETVVQECMQEEAARHEALSHRLSKQSTGPQTMPSKLRNKVEDPDTSSSLVRSMDSGLMQRAHVNVPVETASKALVKSGSSESRQLHTPEGLELRTLPLVEARAASAQQAEGDMTSPMATAYSAKAEQAPASVVSSLKETTAYLSALLQRHYELMKQYGETFARAERLDDLLDKSRNERDDSKQELDALKLLLDSQRSENAGMKEVLVELNVDLEAYLSSLEHQKRVNARLAKKTHTLETQAAALASTAEQQEFCTMGNIELGLRCEEMTEMENALEDVQNFHDRDLVAKKLRHIGKGIRSVGNFCRMMITMCQSRKRFNTGTLESQRLSLLQGAAELYSRFEWAKEEQNEQLKAQEMHVDC